ncbi:MAG: Nif3-like dinuclear metal center hexameric protein [Flavobacteriales bacterium Tduv]
MKIREITEALERWAPKEYAEDFDNVGLLIGSHERDVQKILITLDTTEAVVQEAIAKGCNLIITFHPILFNGVKQLIGYNQTERVTIAAIKNDIAIYAIHTNLDNVWSGTNHQICERLGLIRKKILIPKIGTLKKLTTYVPKDHAERVRKSLFEAGAGNVGNYNHCSYNFDGVGSFRGNEDSQPVFGKKHQLHFQEETCINVIFPEHKERDLKKALFESHPYEEVSYEIFDLRNINQHLGMGIIGQLQPPMSEISFLTHLKEKMVAPYVRHSRLSGKRIQKIALLAGSGSFALPHAKKEGVDLFLTADLKYHHFFEADHQMIIADIGHYECEQFTKDLLRAYISNIFPNFAVLQSEINTNPIHYH